MNRTRKLGLAAVTALTVMALAASSASALTVQNEGASSNTNCGAVTLFGHSVQQAGGSAASCIIHVTATEILDLEFLGVTVSSCTNEFDMKLDSAGHGYANNQIFTGTPTQCTIQPCTEVGEAFKLPWEVQLSEVGGGYRLRVTFCVLRGGNPTPCTVDVPTSIVSHTYATFAGEAIESNCDGTGGALQFHGNWGSEFFFLETEVEVVM